MTAAFINQYLENQVNTASREQLLIMLYDGAIRFLREAEGAMADRQVVQQGALISKTIGIINELSATLDHEVGGEVAADLEALYDYMNRELLRANLKDDPHRLGEVRKMLTGLRDTWLKAIAQVQAEQLAGKEAVDNPESQVEETVGLSALTGGI